MLLLVIPVLAFGWSPLKQERIDEHLPWGIPILPEPLVQTLSFQTAYIACFNLDHNSPDWSAYHIAPTYLNTPPREKYKTFYGHLGANYDDYTNSGYDRGHLAPFKIAGGIRNGLSEGACGIGYCDQVVREINLMSNIVPQYPSFNRSGGLWYELETRVREHVGDGHDVWVVAGTILWDGTVSTIGGPADVHVPHAFYKIIAWGAAPEVPQVAAFLFPHQESRVGELVDFLVSVDLIEALCGCDFFALLDDEIEAELERQNTVSSWLRFE